MTANELRIGNLFYYGERLAEVSCIFRTHFNCEEHSTRISFGNSIQCNFEPIPLTEEWLLKFGFELEYKSSFTKIFSIENEDYSFRYKYSLKSGIERLDWCGKSINCKYVHQLQNLYFALTGEELTLSE